MVAEKSRRWGGRDIGFWIRRLVGAIVMLIVYLPLAHGSLVLRILYDVLIFGQCAMILGLADRRRRRWAPWVTGVALALAAALVVFGDQPLHHATDALWPLLGWLASMMDVIDPLLTVLYALVSLIVVLTSGMSPISAAVEGFGLVVLFFGVRAGALRRREHEHLVNAYAVLARETETAVRQAEVIERLRVVRDMHDGTGYRLTSLIAQLEAMRTAACGDRFEDAAKLCDEALAAARQALSELRSTVSAIDASMAGEDTVDAGLLRTLVARFERSFQIACTLDIPSAIDELPPSITATLYRALQELLTNAAQHAQARRIDVRLSHDSGIVTLEVTDDGVLTDVSSLQEGFGIRSIRERCLSLGGSLTLAVAGDHGMHATVVLPMAAQ
ncbi:two-component sensor histidine kinase [Alicyclobacillus sacchari]|nr:two-component sensor histidine kinase [Alicyclobacillus sacchari]